MYLDKTGKFVRTDIWREGKWIDLWSIVHCFSGIVMGFFPRYFGLSPFPAYVIVILLLVSYEMFEALAKIKETPQNRAMDVVVGVASFAPAYYLNPFLSLSSSIFFCVVFFTISLTLSIIGWHASRKAEVFEAKLHEEFARGREKFKVRLAERRARRRLRKRQKFEKN